MIQPAFEFAYLTLSEFLNNKDILTEIKHLNPPGVIVRNFFNERECFEIVKGFKQIANKGAELPLNQGIIYPPSVYASEKMNKTDESQRDFFSRCSVFKNSFAEQMGVDAPGRFQHAFLNSSGGRSIQIMPGSFTGSIYPFCTIRSLNPGAGEMSLHCENFLADFAPAFYKHASAFLDHETQLSFYVLIQAAEKGGQLCLYDLLHEDIEQRLNDFELMAKDGKIKDIRTNVKKIKAEMKAGDLVIFNGGRIWHKIELVEGALTRVTLGGFIGFGKNGEVLYYWS